MKFIIFVVLTFNLFAYGLPVCERTQQVQDAIVKKIQRIIKNPTIDCKLANQFLHYINILSLTNREITSLKVGDFSGLTFLKFLFMNNNNLSALPPGLFSGLTSLEAIKLDNNNLSALPAGLFSELPFLKLLYLKPNPLPQAEKDRIRKALPHVSELIF